MSMSDLELRALSVRCPLCSAQPQEPCVSTATIRRVNLVPHFARMEEYRRQRAGTVYCPRVDR